ncbi:MAG: molybdate ABC transporter substrate-binding protein [Sporomusaceae bacterium]|nr:molybdate ABC transporter substrate-binding protein [Sporomusaceae bacterium]
MKKTGFLFVVITALGLILAGCTSQTAKHPDNQPIELTVSAAVSLRDVLAEIQNHYQVKHSAVKINFNLGASGSLQKQIEEGAPVDIFISAAAKQMDDLEKKSLIKKETRKNLVENQLVLIVPRNSLLQLASFEDLSKGEVKQFAMGVPESVPAGQYTQQVLRKLDLYHIVQPKTVLAKDVRTVLTYVETGNVEAGTVYKTDAAANDKVKIIAAAPAGTHDAIVYPIAMLSAAKQVKAAEEFIDYLSSPESKAIFEKHGFIVNK